MFRSFAFVLLLAGSALLTQPAEAEGDAVEFGSTIHVAATDSLHDAVCVFCSVEDEGVVTGDIVAIFGSVHISGEARHDVVSVFGGVHLEDGATIEHDAVSVFGNTRIGRHAKVGHDLVNIFGQLHVDTSASVYGNKVSQPFFFFWTPLVVLGGIIFALVQISRSRRYRSMPPSRLPPAR